MLAWGVILACHYTVAIPLTIWLLCGGLIGGVLGILSIKLIEYFKSRPITQTLSIWTVLNSGIQQLDPNGTRQLLLATVIATLSNLIRLIPAPVGLIMGLVMGNHLLASTIHNLRSAPTPQDNLELFEHRVRLIQQAIDNQIIFKNQLLLQKQLVTLPKYTLPHSSRPPSCSYTPYELTQSHIELKKIDEEIRTTNITILSLKQQLTLLIQDPNRVVENYIYE